MAFNNDGQKRNFTWTFYKTFVDCIKTYDKTTNLKQLGYMRTQKGIEGFLGEKITGKVAKKGSFRLYARLRIFRLKIGRHRRDRYSGTGERNLAARRT